VRARAAAGGAGTPGPCSAGDNCVTKEGSQAIVTKSPHGNGRQFACARVACSPDCGEGAWGAPPTKGSHKVTVTPPRGREVPADRGRPPRRLPPPCMTTSWRGSSRRARGSCCLLGNRCQIVEGNLRRGGKQMEVQRPSSREGFRTEKHSAGVGRRADRGSQSWRQGQQLGTDDPGQDRGRKSSTAAEDGPGDTVD
ncbi:unnamed protein product, partial [Ectocarpus sp. 12 AP-2014]